MTILIPPKQPVVIALGMFDGVHIGHRELLEHTKQLAAKHEAWPCVYTFSNHPQSVISGFNQHALMTADEKVQAISSLGLKVIIEPFTIETAMIEPELFIERLSTCFNLKAVVVGYNHRFGLHGKGTPKMLEQYGKELDFSVEVLPPVLFEEKPVSSTRIRIALLEGDIESANAMLGSPYSFTGTVVAHRQIGSRIGFPTANILPEDKIVPPLGVYASRVVLDDGVYDAVTNVGKRPTVASDDHVVVEAHLLNYAANLYDKRITVQFLTFIRSEKKFKSLDRLKEAIAQDAEKAVELLKRFQS